MVDDVILNKVTIIERCLARIREDYEGFEDEFETNYLRQDAIILNLMRACEAAIDLAMHMVRMKKLGIPQESRAAFTMLEEAKLIDSVTAGHLRAIIGFRNIAVHNYTALDMKIVRAIIEGRVADFTALTKAIMQSVKPENR